MKTTTAAMWRVGLTRRPAVSLALAAVLMAGAATAAVHAEEWRVLVGAESHSLGRQALAFLPNELWIHAGDSIHWIFQTHERHTLTFLKPGQTRPPAFGPTFGVVVGCPGITPDPSSFDGSACVTTGVLLRDDTAPGAEPPQYTVMFPATGNFKLVCLVHADMTGVVHVLDASAALPYDQDSYDRQARRDEAVLLADASRLAMHVNGGEDAGALSGGIAAGIGEVITMSGAGSQSASLMRFSKKVVVVRVGDTVEWTSLEPSINHTVTFGTEPADPRPPLNVSSSLTADGARTAVINSPSDSVNSGFLTPTPQDRANLVQSNPGITRFRVTFTAPGTYEYICAVHDELGMTGTVIVR
ncbi:MAG TPA: plastocyanin/azurin family copper-binding protein [Vicinamibacterales bacterium]|nr:plastocyanin/azurin family copper-binding protein [Vicinamibacterales bacterium]